MPSQAVNKPPSQANEESRTRIIDVQAYRAFINSDSFPDIQKLCAENGKLKKRIAALATTNDTNRETLTDLTQELREERNQRDHHIKRRMLQRRSFVPRKLLRINCAATSRSLIVEFRPTLTRWKRKIWRSPTCETTSTRKQKISVGRKKPLNRLNKELQATQSQLHNSFEELHHANAALASV